MRGTGVHDQCGRGQAVQAEPCGGMACFICNEIGFAFTAVEFTKNHVYTFVKVILRGVQVLFPRRRRAR